MKPDFMASDNVMMKWWDRLESLDISQAFSPLWEILTWLTANRTEISREHSRIGRRKDDSHMSIREPINSQHEHLKNTRVMPGLAKKTFF